MKKILYFLAVCEIVAAIAAFLVLLEHSLLWSAGALFFGILGTVPLFALIRALDDIDSLRAELAALRDRDFRSAPTPEEGAPPLLPSETDWQCLKCRAVNRAGTGICQNCGAYYSKGQNPPNRYRETI